MTMCFLALKPNIIQFNYLIIIKKSFISNLGDEELVGFLLKESKNNMTFIGPLSTDTVFQQCRFRTKEHDDDDGHDTTGIRKNRNSRNFA